MYVFLLKYAVYKLINTQFKVISIGILTPC